MLVGGGPRYAGPLDNVLTLFVETVTNRGSQANQNSRLMDDVNRAIWAGIKRLKSWVEVGHRNGANLVWDWKSKGDVSWAPRMGDVPERLIIHRSVMLGTRPLRR